jgi:hypothetical protein
VALNPRQQLNKQWRKTMADRLTDAFGNKALVERLTEMSREAPELTLSEAIKNIQEDLEARKEQKEFRQAFVGDKILSFDKSVTKEERRKLIDEAKQPRFYGEGDNETNTSKAR